MPTHPAPDPAEEFDPTDLGVADDDNADLLEDLPVAKNRPEEQVQDMADPDDLKAGGEG